MNHEKCDETEAANKPSRCRADGLVPHGVPEDTACEKFLPASAACTTEPTTLATVSSQLRANGLAVSKAVPLHQINFHPNG